MMNDECRRSKQSHPEAKAEGRMKNAENDREIGQSDLQGKAEGRMEHSEGGFAGQYLAYPYRIAGEQLSST